MSYRHLASILRSAVFWLAHGFAALAIGSAGGFVLLGGYWALDPATRESGLGLILVVPIVLTVGILVPMAMGVIPMYILGGLLNWAFSFFRTRHERLRCLVGAAMGSVTGYSILSSNLSYWGDPVAGGLFGCSIMIAWCVVEHASFSADGSTGEPGITQPAFRKRYAALSPILAIPSPANTGPVRRSRLFERW